MINKLTDKTDGQKAIYVINMYLNYKKKRAELGAGWRQENTQKD